MAGRRRWLQVERQRGTEALAMEQRKEEPAVSSWNSHSQLGGHRPTEPQPQVTSSHGLLLPQALVVREPPDMEAPRLDSGDQG